MKNGKLNGKVAVVTGASKGIGAGIAKEFAAEGASVIVNYASAKQDADRVVDEISKRGGKAIAIQGNVAKKAEAERLLAEAEKAFGKIDILVNNAGIAGVNKTVWETDLEEWRKVLRINLDGPFICCKAVVPAMLAQKYGRIVNIASIAGKEGNPNAAHYSASKAGLIALTKSLGKELAQHDILVNAVTPAAAKTAIFDQLTQQHIDFMLSKIPKGRFVLVEELAAMVAWLASEDCAFSTGAVFDISGGRATY